MEYCLTEKQIMLQDEFRNFAKNEILPFAAENDKNEMLPSSIIKVLAGKGYLGTMISEKYGGLGFDSISSGLLNDAIGEACSSVRSLLTVHGMVAVAISKWGNELQKAEWLPRLASGEVKGAFALTESQAGSDTNNIQTTAVKENNYYLLNGTKKWITMGQIADIFVVLAKIDNKPTAFLVNRNTPGLTVTPIRGLIGTRASMVSELHLSKSFVPEENIIGQIGTGLSHVAPVCLDYGRYTIAWGCIGASRACYTYSVKYAKKRKQFGKYLGSNQLIQKMIAEMIININAARLLCMNAGHLRDAKDPDSIVQTWMAKYHASKTLVKVVADAMQIHGANGCSNEYPIERYYRDAKINEIVEGTSQIHEILISTNALMRI